MAELEADAAAEVTVRPQTVVSETVAEIRRFLIVLKSTFPKSARISGSSLKSSFISDGQTLAGSAGSPLKPGMSRTAPPKPVIEFLRPDFLSGSMMINCGAALLPASLNPNALNG
jgi:hypothetical protein